MREIDEGAQKSRHPFCDPSAWSREWLGIVMECGADPRRLAQAARDRLVHMHWRTRYGLDIEQSVAMEEASLRTMDEKLERLSARTRGCLPPFPYERRLLGTCRDFSLFLCSLLRAASLPARLRCGFADYFSPGSREDHWITEWYDAVTGRWVMADAQLDDLMIESLGISFDPDDLPRGAFISAGEAWTACRLGDDPGRYGIFDMRGWDFIKGNVIRDIASLAGFPMEPWDLWGLMACPFTTLTGEDLLFMDRLALDIPMGVSMGPEEAGRRMSDPRLSLPAIIRTLSPEGRLVDSDISALLAT